MDGVYYPPKLPGAPYRRSHAAVNDPAAGWITLCQRYPILSLALIDCEAGESQIGCARCLGELAKRRAMALRPAVDDRAAPAVAALQQVVPGQFVDRGIYLPHDEVVGSGLLKALNGPRRSDLPLGLFFTCEADTHAQRRGEAVLRILDARDDAEQLAKLLAIVDATRR